VSRPTDETLGQHSLTGTDLENRVMRPDGQGVNKLIGYRFVSEERLT
jgi:hypothetical protein